MAVHFLHQSVLGNSWNVLLKVIVTYFYIAHLKVLYMLLQTWWYNPGHQEQIHYAWLCIKHLASVCVIILCVECSIKSTIYFNDRAFIFVDRCQQPINNYFLHTIPLINSSTVQSVPAFTISAYASDFPLLVSSFYVCQWQCNNWYDRSENLTKLTTL